MWIGNVNNALILQFVNIFLQRKGFEVSFFKRNNAKCRSFEEITRTKDDLQDENEEVDVDVEEKVEDKPPKKTVNGFPFGQSEFNALSCFGMKEDRTDKWLGKCVKVWFCCMSFIWFLFGTLTFAPVIFISNKINVIFNDKKKSLLFAIILHVVILSLIFVLIFTKHS